MDTTNIGKQAVRSLCRIGRNFSREKNLTLNHPQIPVEETTTTTQLPTLTNTTISPLVEVQPEFTR
jgi:hypothetical protein